MILLLLLMMMMVMGTALLVMSCPMKSRMPSPVAAEAISKSSCRLKRTLQYLIMNDERNEGQTSSDRGDFTLDMDFKVAMNNTANNLGTPTAADVASDGTLTLNSAVNVVDRPTWGVDTDVAADDTTLQIMKMALDGNKADEDYFLFTPASSGLLTVNANETTPLRKKTRTPKGRSLVRWERVRWGKGAAGQIAADTDSGPGGHFGFSVPVEGNRDYLVKVEGTDGAYELEFVLAGTDGRPRVRDADHASLRPHPRYLGS